MSRLQEDGVVHEHKAGAMKFLSQNIRSVVHRKEEGAGCTLQIY